MPFKFDLVTKLPKVSTPNLVIAEVFNRARTEGGRHNIFKLVNQGRGPIFPKKGKALKIPLRGGSIPGRLRTGGTASPVTGIVPSIIAGSPLSKFRFAKFAKAAPGKFFLGHALSSTARQAPTILATSTHSVFSREYVVSFVNRLAEASVAQLKRRTPKKTGKLAGSYFINKAT